MTDSQILVGGGGRAGGQLLFRDQRTDSGGELSFPLFGRIDTLQLDASKLAGYMNFEVDIFGYGATGPLTGSRASNEFTHNGQRWNRLDDDLSIVRLSLRPEYEYARLVLPGHNSHFEVNTEPYPANAAAALRGRWRIAYLALDSFRNFGYWEILLDPDTWIISANGFGPRGRGAPGNNWQPVLHHVAVFAA